MNGFGIESYARNYVNKALRPTMAAKIHLLLLVESASFSDPLHSLMQKIDVGLIKSQWEWNRQTANVLTSHVIKGDRHYRIEIEEEHKHKTGFEF
jgi:hypothetical protein